MRADPRAKFFVYGGLFFPMEELPVLDRRVRRIRAECGYRIGDELKFETRARPDHVSIDQARDAKRRVVEAAIEVGAKLIVDVVLHTIARNRSQDELISWAADAVIGKFNQYLDHVGDYGVCAVDRLPINADHRYLSDKFTYGLRFPDGDRIDLNRIKLLASTCINASHASSVMDIVLGSFRYCINTPTNVEVARAMMVNVTRLIWHVREGETIHALEKGLIFRPKLENIQVDEYRQEYLDLVEHINSLIADADDL